jgi:hypothetical protein
LENNGKTKQEEDQSIDKVDCGSVQQKEVSQGNHGIEIVAYGCRATTSELTLAIRFDYMIVLSVVVQL